MLGCTPQCVKVVSLACCYNLTAQLNYTLSTLVIHSAQFHYVMHSAAVIKITSFRSRISCCLRPQEWRAGAVSQNGFAQSVDQAVQEDSCWKAWPEDKISQPLDTSVSTVQEGASFCLEKLKPRMNQYATLIDSHVDTTILFTQIENTLRLLQSASRRIEPGTTSV